MTSATIVLDSVNSHGSRLTTFVITFHRFILPEFNTHRCFSRNTSSSRAIPTSKLIEEIKNNPAIPVSFNRNQKGMQAGSPLEDQEEAKKHWLIARDKALEQAEQLIAMGVHKEVTNRLIEPFMWTTMVVSSTNYANFFALRNHKDAQPEIQLLAKKMLEAYNNSTPKLLQPGEWHLPFVDDACIIDTVNNHSVTDLQDTLIKRSVARCARVSYKNHDKTNTTVEQDLDLYDRLVGSRPGHFSPTEHQAMASEYNVSSGNFSGGWEQYRKGLAEEYVV